MRSAPDTASSARMMPKASTYSVARSAGLETPATIPASGRRCCSSCSIRCSGGPQSGPPSQRWLGGPLCGPPEHLIEQELQQRRPLAGIVAGVSNPAERATLYVLAFGIIRADEAVSGAERIYLAQLAHLLGLDPETVTRLEHEASTRIDSQKE